MACKERESLVWKANMFHSLHCTELNLTLHNIHHCIACTALNYTTQYTALHCLHCTVLQCMKGRGLSHASQDEQTLHQGGTASGLQCSVQNTTLWSSRSQASAVMWTVEDNDEEGSSSTGPLASWEQRESWRARESDKESGRVRESLGESGRIRESQGESRSVREKLGESWRVRKGQGESWKIREILVTVRRVLERPGE